MIFFKFLVRQQNLLLISFEVDFRHCLYEDGQKLYRALNTFSRFESLKSNEKKKSERKERVYLL